MKQQVTNSKATIRVIYSDGSKWEFDITPKCNSSNEYQYIILTATRGALMAMNGAYATATNALGETIAEYVK